MNRNDRLFSSNDWSSVRGARKRAIHDEIEALDPDRLLSMGVDTAVQYFIDKSAEVPVLDRPNLVVDQREVARTINDYGRNISIKTTVIDVTVPFEGAADAFGIRPSSYLMSSPIAVVATEHLFFSVDAYNRDQGNVKKEIEGTLDDIETNLDNLRRDIATFQKEVPGLARDLIERRRTKLLADRNLVSSLGYKLRARADAPRTYAAPEIRRKITPRLPAKGVAPFKPEPTLPIDDYEHILSIIHDMALVMERSPSAFKSLDEEALRSHFLVQLNGHYEGGASGETFNYQGKTDILIRVEGRNIFVAECKFWGGPKMLTDTIDQLLGYTSWRDTKTAIIIFNRNKDFTKVLASIPETMKAHPNFLHSDAAAAETRFRYTFSHRDDPSRELTLAVLAFDVPKG